MIADAALEEIVTRLQAQTGYPRIAVLAVLGDRLAQVRVNPEDAEEIAKRAAAIENVTAAIDREIAEGL